MGLTDEGKQLLARAMALSPKERAEIAAKLVASVNAFAEAERAWSEVIEDRARRALVDALRFGDPAPRVTPSRVRFDVDAEVDVEQATTWYAAQPGQVDALLGELGEAIDQIRRAPGAFGGYAGVAAGLGVRRTFLREFPYTLAFVHIGDELRVLAVAHNYRAPGEAEITVDALIAVEHWLAIRGVRALSWLAGMGAVYAGSSRA